MQTSTRNKLISIIREIVVKNNPSHDIDHALRVTALTEKIASAEGGKAEILIPAALFHDAVVYQKNDFRRHDSQGESAALAANILRGLPGFSESIIRKVTQAIEHCSFSEDNTLPFIESKILNIMLHFNLKVQDRLATPTARELVKKRTRFLYEFLLQLESELKLE